MNNRSIFSILISTVLCFNSANSWAQDLLSTIKDRKEIIVATEAAFKPYEFIENGKIVGYDQDLLKFVMDGLPGVKITQIDTAWASLLPGLVAGKFDIVVGAGGITPERYDKFAVSYPIGDATVALLKRAKNKSLNVPEDINGRIVGAQIGTSQLRALQHYNEKQKSLGKPGVKEIKQYTTVNEAYADLAAGRTDAVAQSLSVLASVVKERSDMFAAVKPTIGPKAYFAWTARKDKESESLINYFNERIAEANTSGKLKELQLKWFGAETPLPLHVPEPSELK